MKSSPPFIPSTNASIASTPAMGAATTTGKWSRESAEPRKSSGVRGSERYVDEEPEKRRGGTLFSASHFDLLDGPVLERVLR